MGGGIGVSMKYFLHNSVYRPRRPRRKLPARKARQAATCSSSKGFQLQQPNLPLTTNPYPTKPNQFRLKSMDIEWVSESEKFSADQERQGACYFGLVF